MIAVSVKERATTRSKGEEEVALAPPSGNTVLSEVAVHTLAASPAERHAMIAEAAYYIAEQRGFEPGRELVDWLRAEREVCGKLR